MGWLELRLAHPDAALVRAPVVYLVCPTARRNGARLCDQGTATHVIQVVPSEMTTSPEGRLGAGGASGGTHSGVWCRLHQVAAC